MLVYHCLTDFLWQHTCELSLIMVIFFVLLDSLDIPHFLQLHKETFLNLYMEYRSPSSDNSVVPTKRKTRRCAVFVRVEELTIQASVACPK